MAKVYPAEELKPAIKTLNVVLKKNKTPLIKVVGVKKEEIVKSFTEHLLDFIKDGREAELPDEAIDFYNNHIANEGEEAEEVEETAEKGKSTRTAGKGKSTGKGKGKTAGKGKKAPKSKAPKSKSVVELTVDLFMKDGLRSNADIVKKLQGKFPDRNIASTVSSAMCVLKHVEKHITD